MIILLISKRGSRLNLVNCDLSHAHAIPAWLERRTPLIMIILLLMCVYIMQKKSLVLVYDSLSM